MLSSVTSQKRRASPRLYIEVYSIVQKEESFVRSFHACRPSTRGISCLRNVSGEAEEEGLGCELEGPDAHLLYAALACGSVFEDVAGEGFVHLK